MTSPTKLTQEDQCAQVAEGLSQIFQNRESFIVIGLTGRTGSGCSSAATILNSNNFNETGYPKTPWPGNNNENRKDGIVATWLREHWSPFTIIQVSQVILLLALSDGLDNFLQWVEQEHPRCAPSLKSANLESFDITNRVISTLTNLHQASQTEIREAYFHIFESLPKLSEIVKEALNSESKDFATLFQAMGDNLRQSGSPLSNETNPLGILKIPETIVKIIELARTKNQSKTPRREFFVIDALRHPFEIRYLREKISPFYSIAITTDDAERRSRLQSNNLRAGEIAKLDTKEYPSESSAKREGYSSFVSQDIQACLEISDIHIHNPGKPEFKDTSKIASRLCRYVALMQHPGLITPTREERCMQLAFAARLNSGCLSRQVGAVITDSDFSVKAVGWNDVPYGQVPCLLRNTTQALMTPTESDVYSDFEQHNAQFERP